MGMANSRLGHNKMVSGRWHSRRAGKGDREHFSAILPREQRSSSLVGRSFSTLSIRVSLPSSSLGGANTRLPILEHVYAATRLLALTMK